MNKLIEFNVPGGRVLVETQEAATGSVVRGVGVAEVTEKVGKSFEDALSVIHSVAEAAMNTCKGLDVAPDLVEVEFGLKFGAKVDVVIAKGIAEGNLRIKLAWKPA
ncbi:CU044_2847 family protein [Massilia consociata]|uniref:CU044_2847 family protein n=1 Tax=Massilia consociata TaxID=760117 RepID=A0ABV6FLX9_9BURK